MRPLIKIEKYKISPQHFSYWEFFFSIYTNYIWWISAIRPDVLRNIARYIYDSNVVVGTLQHIPLCKMLIKHGQKLKKWFFVLYFVHEMFRKNEQIICAKIYDLTPLLPKHSFFPAIIAHDCGLIFQEMCKLSRWLGPMTFI